MRSALPQNYQNGIPILLEDFSDFAKWDAEKVNMAVSIDSVNVKAGSQSIKMKPTQSNVPCTIDRTFTAPINISGNGQFVLRVYVHAEQGLNGIISALSGTTATIRIHLSSVVNYATYHTWVWTLGWLRPGWNDIPIFPQMRGGATETLEAAQRMRITIHTGATTTAANCPEITLDSLHYNAKPLPAKLVLTFDDGWKSVYDNIFPYMRDRGIRATMYAIPQRMRDLPGGSSLHCSTAEIRAMHDAGWCIANHTIDHSFYRTNSVSVAAYKEKTKQCIDWLISNGYNKGAYHIAYPQGEYDQLVIEALKELGMRTGRGAYESYFSTTDQDFMQIPMRGFNSGRTATYARDLVDYCIGKGGTQFLMFHQIPIDDTVNNGGDSQATIAFSQAKMIGLIDYIIEREIECITVDEWYEGLTKPRFTRRSS